MANVGIVAAGLITLLFRSIWPDGVVGLAIALMNLDACKGRLDAAREEHRLINAEV